VYPLNFHSRGISFSSPLTHAALSVYKVSIPTPLAYLPYSSSRHRWGLGQRPVSIRRTLKLTCSKQPRVPASRLLFAHFCLFDPSLLHEPWHKHGMSYMYIFLQHAANLSINVSPNERLSEAYLPVRSGGGTGLTPRIEWFQIWWRGASICFVVFWREMRTTYVSCCSAAGLL
jgi:hypothetical protein